MEQKNVTCVEDLLDYYIDKSLVRNNPLEQLANLLYNYTDCGMYVEPITRENSLIGLNIGSIVEGSDANTENYKMIFPFTFEEWNNNIELIEDEARELWNEVNLDMEEN